MGEKMKENLVCECGADLEKSPKIKIYMCYGKLVANCPVCNLLMPIYVDEYGLFYTYNEKEK